MKKIFLLSIIFFSAVSAKAFDGYDKRHFAKAEITDIIQNEISNADNSKMYETKFKLKILSGKFKGQNKEITFQGEDSMPQDVKYRKGNRIFLAITEDNYNQDNPEYISLYDIDNSKPLIFLSLLTFLMILGIGRLKGFLSLMSLIFTIMLIFIIFIPLTLKGFSPLLLSIGISFISIIITLPVITGFSLKTAAAIAGSFSGILLAALLALIAGSVMHLSGIITDDMLTVHYASDIQVNLKHLALSGMIIAALGAIMDVAVSIASAANEIYSAKPDIDDKTAFRSVFTIGKDILGSMVNTLVLAYAGSSLALILIISLKFSSEMPFMMILNYNPVLSEIIKALIGSIGMFFCIPATAIISVKLFHRKHNSGI
ncbi:MAG: YibE/F family protein [Spirochaetes bacterium]|nr:YibE/F family protein [Spirochaetota bacterium]